MHEHPYYSQRSSDGALTLRECLDNRVGQFMVKIAGDCLEPHIPDGAMLRVDSTAAIEDGAFCLCERPGFELVAKRLRLAWQDGRRVIELWRTNPPEIAAALPPGEVRLWRIVGFKAEGGDHAK